VIYAWLERARDYDAYQETVKETAIDMALMREAERWAARRSALYEHIHGTLIQLADQARALAMMPTVTRTKSTDAHTTIIQAVEPNTVRAAAGTLRQVFDVASSLFAQTIGPELAESAETGTGTEPNPAPMGVGAGVDGPPRDAIAAEATRRIETFRAARRADILRMPDAPPDAPEPDSGAGSGTGTG